MRLLDKLWVTGMLFVWRKRLHYWEWDAFRVAWGMDESGPTDAD